MYVYEQAFRGMGKGVSRFQHQQIPCSTSCNAQSRGADRYAFVFAYVREYTHVCVDVGMGAGAYVDMGVGVEAWAGAGVYVMLGSGV